MRRGLSWEGVVWAFTERHEILWQPLTWLSHMVNFELFGMHPAGHHATNVLLHLANALLFFELLRRLTGAPGRSAFAAALFALHPLRAESVAWVAELKDVLAGTLGLLSLHAYATWARGGRRRHYVLSSAWLALGLMAKPTLVTLPFLLLLLDHWPLRRWNAWRQTGRRVLEKLPHLGLALAASVVTLLVQQPAMQAARAVPLGARLANAALACATYLRKAVWPSDLAAHYAHPYLPGVGGSPPAAWEVAACALGLAVLTALALRSAAPRYARVGWLWYLGGLVPMIGLVQVGTQALADRYTYLPLLGLAVIAAWGGRDLLRRLGPSGERLAPALAGAVAAALAAAAFVQVGVWRDSTSLFERAVALEPRNVVANSNLGRAYEVDGRLDEAIARYRQALAVNPVYWAAHFNLGNALRQQDRLDEAAHHYRRVLDLQPDDARAAGNLAGVLRMQGRADEARRIYTTILRNRPGDRVALLNLESMAQAEGRESHAEIPSHHGDDSGQ